MLVLAFCGLRHRLPEPPFGRSVIGHPATSARRPDPPGRDPTFSRLPFEPALLPDSPSYEPARAVEAFASLDKGRLKPCRTVV
jgi:hypothetical protein